MLIMTVDGYAAIAKSELLATTRADRAELERLVQQTGDRLTEPGLAGDWSVKDMIAHICAYERWLVRQMGGRVRDLPEPPPTVNMNDVDQRNAWFFEIDHQRPVDDVLTEAREVYEQLLTLVEACSEEELRDTFTVDPRGNLEAYSKVEAAWSGWPLWRWVISVTFDHYRQHLPALRAWLEQQRPNR